MFRRSLPSETLCPSLRKDIEFHVLTGHRVPRSSPRARLRRHASGPAPSRPPTSLLRRDVGSRATFASNVVSGRGTERCVLTRSTACARPTTMRLRGQSIGGVPPAALTERSGSAGGDIIHLSAPRCDAALPRSRRGPRTVAPLHLPSLLLRPLLGLRRIPPRTISRGWQDPPHSVAARTIVKPLPLVGHLFRHPPDQAKAWSLALASRPRPHSLARDTTPRRTLLRRLPTGRVSARLIQSVRPLVRPAAPRRASSGLRPT